MAKNTVKATPAASKSSATVKGAADKAMPKDASRAANAAKPEATPGKSVLAFTPKAVVNSGIGILKAWSTAHEKHVATEAAKAAEEKSRFAAISMATLAISELFAKDARIFSVMERIAGGGDDSMSMERALNTIRFGLGLGTVVKGENGHELFEYTPEAEAMLSAPGSVDGSAEANKAEWIKKNFGQMLKTASSTALSVIDAKLTIGKDEKTGLAKVTGPAVKRLFGADPKSGVVLGQQAKPIAEGKLPPSFKSLATVATKARGASAGDASGANADASGAKVGASTATPSEAVMSACNVLIEALARAKGLGPLDDGAIKSLINVREACNVVIPSTLIKGGQS